MGQVNCYGVIEAETHGELNDGDSYIDEYQSISSIMSPKSRRVVEKSDQFFIDPIYIPCALDQIKMIDQSINSKIRDRLKELQPFSYSLDDNTLNYTSQVYILNQKQLAYCGQWKDGLPHGFGVQFQMDHVTYYEGQTISGVAHGYGRKIFKDGSVVQGFFIYGDVNGEGIYISNEDHKFEGHFLKGKPHGPGKETWSDGSQFNGTFENGQKKKGTFIWRLQKDHINFEVNEESYTGQYENNLYHGQGKYVWCDGRNFEGKWQDGKMHGAGIYHWPDGRRYIGMFENDLRDGEGIIIWNSDKQWRGNWTKGQMNGIGIYTKKGIAQEGEWKQGERVNWTNNTYQSKNTVSGISSVNENENVEVKSQVFGKNYLKQLNQ